MVRFGGVHQRVENMRNPVNKGQGSSRALVHTIGLAIIVGTPIFVMIAVFGGVGVAIGVAISIGVFGILLAVNPPQIRLLCKFRHLGTWFYDSDAECSQTLACSRCGVQSRRFEHDVPEWDSPSSTWQLGPWGSKESGRCSHCHQVAVQLSGPGDLD